MKKVIPRFNDFETQCPEMAKKWHPTKNGHITPLQILAGSGHKYWFTCEICGSDYKASPNSLVWGFRNRTIKNRIGGCLYCKGQSLYTAIFEDSLAYKYPELLKEWDYDKNNEIGLKPETTHPNSKTIAFWICPKKHPYKLSIQSSIHTQKSSCPYCNNKKVLPGFNDLVTKFPKTIKIWDFNKNIINPHEIAPHSSKEAWFICSKCGKSYNRLIKYQSQRNESWCSRCSPKSIGEEYLCQILDNYNIRYKREKTFNNLHGIGGGRLMFDFYLFDYNTCIEYHGEQHYNRNSFKFIFNTKDFVEFDKLQVSDIKKEQYCINNNINLIIIPYIYRYVTHIEDYLNEYAPEIFKNTHRNFTLDVDVSQK